MLRSLTDFIGFELKNKDKSKGEVIDFLFDDQNFTIKHVEIDLGLFIPGKKVLLGTEHLIIPDQRSGQLETDLTASEIENLPPLKSDRPVSMQWESRLDDIHQGQGSTNERVYFLGRPYPVDYSLDELKERSQQFDYNLRSLSEVGKYKVHCLDAEFGHIDDMIVDTESWDIKTVVISTRNWMPGKRVMLSPEKIVNFDWIKQKVHIPIPQNDILNEKTFHPRQPVNRGQKTSSFKDYYGRKTNTAIDYHSLF